MSSIHPSTYELARERTNALIQQTVPEENMTTGLMNSQSLYTYSTTHLATLLNAVAFNNSAGTDYYWNESSTVYPKSSDSANFQNVDSNASSDFFSASSIQALALAAQQEEEHGDDNIAAVDKGSVDVKKRRKKKYRRKKNCVLPKKPKTSYTFYQLHIMV
jgi:hypothetical protein